MFALLGPDGAGKTTTVRILSTLITPEAGSARLLGFDLLRQGTSVRSVIAVTGQFSAVDDLLAGEENLISCTLPLARALAHGGQACRWSRGERRTSYWTNSNIAIWSAINNRQIAVTPLWPLHVSMTAAATT